MKKVFLKIKNYLILLGVIFVFTLITSIIYYFSNMSYKTLSNILLIFMIVILFVFNFKSGRNTISKGYKNGLKNGLITILLFYIIGSFMLNFKITLSKFIYYLIVIVVSSFGSMIGINTKK